MSKHSKKRPVTRKPGTWNNVLASMTAKVLGQFLFDLWKEYGWPAWQNWLAA